MPPGTVCCLLSATLFMVLKKSAWQRKEGTASGSGTSNIAKAGDATSRKLVFVSACSGTASPTHAQRRRRSECQRSPSRTTSALPPRSRRWERCLRGVLARPVACRGIQTRRFRYHISGLKGPVQWLPEPARMSLCHLGIICGKSSRAPV